MESINNYLVKNSQKLLEKFLVALVVVLCVWLAVTIYQKWDGITYMLTPHYVWEVKR